MNLEKKNGIPGLSLKDAPRLFIASLRTWEGWLAIIGTVVLAIILPHQFKITSFFVAIVFFSAAFQKAVQKQKFNSSNKVTSLTSPSQLKNPNQPVQPPKL